MSVDHPHYHKYRQRLRQRFSKQKPGFEVIDTEGRPPRPHRAHQGLGDIDHEHREIGAIINRSFLDAHEVIETPRLFRISKIELQLEAQPIVVDHLRISQTDVAAEEHHMRRFLGVQMRFHEHNNIGG